VPIRDLRASEWLRCSGRCHQNLEPQPRTAIYEEKAVTPISRNAADGVDKLTKHVEKHKVLSMATIQYTGDFLAIKERQLESAFADMGTMHYLYL
jgi:hypothetical protein